VNIRQEAASPPLIVKPTKIQKPQDQSLYGFRGLPLRRLRVHGLITRIRGTHRYQVTDAGLHHALFLTRLHDRFLRTGLAELADPDPPTPLRAASRAYQNALDGLTRQAGLTAPADPRHHTRNRPRSTKPDSTFTTPAPQAL
jgi:hypothetical protein